MRAPPCPTILVTCQPALNMGSVAPVTVSVPPMIPPCLPSMHVMGYPTVLMQGLPATQLTSPSIGNGGCAPIGATLVPNVTNVFYGYAREGTESGAPAGGITLDELHAIDRSLAGAQVECACLEGGVARVRVHRFAASVPGAVFHSLRGLGPGRLASVLLDLRGSGGGEVAALVRLAGQFLALGALVATLVDGDGDEVELRSQQAIDHDVPVVVLVDRGTASVAEVLAGSLQAHGRAVVVGERTYGKGDVQMVVAAADGTTRYETVGTLRLPGGRSVQGRGVEPDLPAPDDGVVRWEARASCLPVAMRIAVRKSYLRENDETERTRP
jgi:carboxyl-terminal processing protease